MCISISLINEVVTILGESDFQSKKLFNQSPLDFVCENTVLRKIGFRTAYNGDDPGNLTKYNNIIK